MASFRAKSSNTKRSSSNQNRFLTDTTKLSPYRERLSESESDNESCSKFTILPPTPNRLESSPSFSSPSKSSRKSANSSLIKQVLTDIEEARKSDPSVRPCDVFDKKPDIYGERDSALRRKAQNIYSYQYHVKVKSPPNTRSSIKSASIEAPLVFDTMSVNTDSSEYMALKKFVPEGFNLKRIEYFDVEFHQNKTGIEIGCPGYGGVEVTMFNEFKHDDKLYTCFELAATGEYRDTGEDSNFFKAAIVAPNQVAVVLPNMDRMFQDDYQDVWEKYIDPKHGLYCERTEKAHKLTRVMLKNDENAHYLSRVAVLLFPMSMHLSNTIFSPGSENGLIQSNRIPMHIKLRGGKLHINKTRVFWKVHVKDDKAKKVEIPKAKRKEEFVQMESMFSNIGIFLSDEDANSTALIAMETSPITTQTFSSNTNKIIPYTVPASPNTAQLTLLMVPRAETTNPASIAMTKAPTPNEMKPSAQLAPIAAKVAQLAPIAAKAAHNDFMTTPANSNPSASHTTPKYGLSHKQAPPVAMKAATNSFWVHSNAPPDMPPTPTTPANISPPQAHMPTSIAMETFSKNLTQIASFPGKDIPQAASLPTTTLGSTGDYHGASYIPTSLQSFITELEGKLEYHQQSFMTSAANDNKTETPTSKTGQPEQHASSYQDGAASKSSAQAIREKAKKFSPLTKPSSKFESSRREILQSQKKTTRGCGIARFEPPRKICKRADESDDEDDDDL